MSVQSQQQHQGSPPHPLGTSISGTGESGLRHTGSADNLYGTDHKPSEATASSEGITASSPSLSQQGGTEATLIATASSHEALQRIQQEQQQQHHHQHHHNTGKLRSAMLGGHSMAQADIVAFAAQAAQAAHADHVVAMRKKQIAAAVAAAENAALRALENAKESSKQQQQQRSVIISGSAASGAGGGGASGGGADRRGGGAGAAYCLIPQPYHSNNSRDVNHHRRDGMTKNTTNSMNSGDGSSLGGGGRSVGSGHIMLTGGSDLGDQLADGRSNSDGGRVFESQQHGSGAMVPSTKRAREDGMLGDLNHGAEMFGDGGEGGVGGGGSSSSVIMSAECRLERSREQNRQSSRKARMRRKGEEMSLKDQIQSIQVFRLMVEEGPDMMSIHGLDHRAPFRYASSAFQRVAGINPRDVLGRGLTDLIAVEDHGVVQQALLKVVFSHESDHIVSYRMLTPEGTALVVETSIRTGDQCIICVGRVAHSQPQSPPPPRASISKALMDSPAGNSSTSSTSTSSHHDKLGAPMRHVSGGGALTTCTVPVGSQAPFGCYGGGGGGGAVVALARGRRRGAVRKREATTATAGCCVWPLRGAGGEGGGRDNGDRGSDRCSELGSDDDGEDDCA